MLPTLDRESAVRGALALRAPVLTLLAGRAPDAAARAALGADVDTWELLLAADCCAIPVARALRAGSAWTALTLAARATVAMAESCETERVLGVRAQLAELDRVAAALGVMPIVLRGAAAVADGTPLEVGELDLLVTDDVVEALASALVRCGYTREGNALTRAGALPIAVHERVPYGRVDVGAADGGADRAAVPPLVPLAGCRALRRLVGAPALMVLLRHAVQPGPFRRGQLRDLVAIAESLGRCGPGEVELVARACAADRGDGDLADVLGLARALRTGDEPVDPPGVRRTAAQRYGVALGTSYGGAAVTRLAG